MAKRFFVTTLLLAGYLVEKSFALNDTAVVIKALYNRDISQLLANSSEECHNIQKYKPNSLKDFVFDCTYGPGDSSKFGVNAAELTKFLTRDWDTDRDNMNYTLKTEPGKLGCNQVYCIGDHASLNICEIENNPEGVRTSVTGARLFEFMTQFKEMFWPEKPWEASEDNPATFAAEWVKQPVDTRTCCRAYSHEYTQPKSSDRIEGVAIYEGSPTRSRVKISIEPIKNKSQSAVCDPKFNLVGEPIQ
ncbi:hypothetical protein ABW20_dc0102916 [Dactylellina cionopaga]|nr:hypothetical protein ABW20_dc0102916 [Dactylellina cionopaga]